MIELQTLMLLIAAQNYCNKLHNIAKYSQCVSKTTECLEGYKYVLTNKKRIEECLK